MNTINSSGPLALLEGPDNFEGEAFLKSILNSERINPEFAPLKMMGEMIHSYRRDIASLQEEHEKLLDQKSSQDLVNIHMSYRMTEIQQSIKRSTAGLKALQADFLGYRTIVLQQSNDKKNAGKSSTRLSRKLKKA